MFMKPQDLKVPFLWEDRRPWFADHVLHVPRYYFHYDRFTMPTWDEFFGNTAPIFCELCSGNGDWIVAQALHHPEYNWIAVEQRFDRVRKIWSKMHNQGVTNLRIVSGQAQDFFKAYVSDAAFRQIIINFPDPWPKSRHRKHRLFQKPFFNDMVRALLPKGALILVTDDLPYMQEATQVMQKELQPVCPAPYYEEVNEYGNSWFERLWRSKGQGIFYTEFIKEDWDIADSNSRPSRCQRDALTN